MDTESVTLELDPRSVLSAIKEANKAVEGWEKGTVGAGDRMQKALERQAEMLLKLNDRSRSSMERLTASIEKQAAAYGKTGVERLIAERDRWIKKLGDEAGMVDRVKAAYDKMIEAENRMGASEIKQLGAEARESKASLALMGEEIGVHIPRHIRGFIAAMPGVGSALSAAFSAVAVVALIGVIYEAIKKVSEFREHLEQLREAPERLEAEFARQTGAMKIANDEMRVANDRLQNAIAKLEHKPQNNLQIAIHEAVLEAEQLAEKLDKSLHSYLELLKTNQSGLFDRIFLRATNDKDIAELVGGKSGFGGMIGDIYKATNAGGDPTVVLSRYRSQAQHMLDVAENNRNFQEGKKYRTDLGPVEVTAEQSARIEKLQALLAQIQAMSDSYNLEKENRQLADRERRLQEIAKATSVTEDLRQQVARAQEGELNGLDKINAAYKERLRHLQQEGQLNKINVALAKQIRDAEIDHFQKTERRQTSTALFGANNSIAEANIRSSQALFQATRRASGAAAGVPDIDAEYNTSMALAQNQFDLAARHVQELRAAKATQGEIERAQIEATKNFALAALDAETKRKVALVELAKQQRDEEEKTARAAFENQKRLTDAIAGEREKHDRDGLQRQIKMAEALGVKTSGGELQTAGIVEQLRIASAAMQRDQAVARIGQEMAEATAHLNGAKTPEGRRQWESEITKLKIDGIRAEGDLQRQIDEAHEDRVLKTAEIQKKQLEEIQGKTSGLLHTLFTKPTEFGKQLRDTIREALLKPVSDGIGGMIAGTIRPLIYGADGQGGIAGVFKGVFGGGKQDPMKVSMDVNTAVTAQNSAAVAALTVAMAGFLGMGGVPSAAAAPLGAGGISIPTIAGPAVAGAGAVGAASLPAVLAAGAASTAGVGGGIVDQVLKGGFAKGSTFSGFGQIWKNLKNTDWGGFSHNATGGINGVHGVAGAGLDLGGLMLGQQGLLGSWRGTWGGVAAGAAGGAMIGFQMGGPLGAAIGGIAGGLIGLGEKIAGVETPENEAKRLVKQIYGLSINDATAKQIAALAKQSYGGQVSVAVRSPEVRQLLQLYAESTGQKSMLFLNDPHGVNLTQAGGLYQSAVWNNGTPFTFASNLPVMGPAGSTIPSGNPYAGGTNITLVVNGQSAADLLEGRAANFIADNPRSVSAAATSGWGGGPAMGSNRVDAAATIFGASQIAF